MKFGKRVESVPYLEDVLEILLAFIIAWIFYQGLAFAAGTPMPIVSVVSESMEPVLHRGDLVFVVAPKDLKVGDVVIYQREGSQFTIIHRVIESRPEGYIIKGDNNPRPDSGTVTQKQINGKVLFALPLLGYPRLALYAVGI